MKPETVLKTLTGIAVAMAMMFGAASFTSAQEAATPSAAKPAATKPAAKPENPCRKLDESACTAAAGDSCRWLPARTAANGKKLNPVCRKVANPCVKLSESSCGVAKAACRWLAAGKTTDGKDRPASCRKLPPPKKEG